MTDHPTTTTAADEAERTTRITATEPARAWVLLKSGQRLNLLDPHPMSWTDADLATGLARTYRWGGHSRWDLPLSVAQHSLTVLALAEAWSGRPLTPAERLRALLHDADEGLLGFDAITPLKPHLGDGYAQVAHRLTRAIAGRYRLPGWTTEAHAIHKRADAAAAASEALHVVGWSPGEIRHHLRIRTEPLDTDPVPPPPGMEPWEPWPPKLAAAMFLAALAPLVQAVMAEPAEDRDGPDAWFHSDPGVRVEREISVEGDNTSLRGVIVAGTRDYDGAWDLDGTFTVRTEDGELFRVQGWTCVTEDL